MKILFNLFLFFKYLKFIKNLEVILFISKKPSQLALPHYRVFHISFQAALSTQNMKYIRLEKYFGFS